MSSAIIGVGSIIFKDDGVGVYASNYIEQNYTFKDDITIVDGGVLGFGLISYLQDYDRVLILDTITADGEVGEIYNIPSEELLGLGSYKQSAHEVEVVEMLEACALLENVADVKIIGIIPKDIVSVEISLSGEVEEKFDEFISVALQELDAEYEKSSTEVTLKEIVERFRC
jgi:hydrogenase maturation protease